MLKEILDVATNSFSAYGIELIGSFLLALILTLFYTNSHMRTSLKYLSYAFYAIAFKNIFLIAFNLIAHTDHSWKIPVEICTWIDFSLICVATSLFIVSAFQISRILFSGFNFAAIATLILIGSGYIVGHNPKTATLFNNLPTIYISASFLTVGFAMLSLKGTQKTTLHATGLGFTLLSIYYAQEALSLNSQAIVYQASIYLVVFVLALYSQISLLNLYCATLEHNLASEKSRRSQMLQISPFPILITRLLDDTVLYINPAAKKIFKIAEEDVKNFLFSSYFADPIKRVELLSRIKRETVIQSFPVQLKAPKTMQSFWVDISARIIDFDGELALYMACKDITQKKKQEDELFIQASTDPLTGLFNRRQFEVLCNKQISLAIRHHNPYCTIMIDIDHFKKVNDTYGHDAGDEVLKQLSFLLKSILRESDIMARFGGEEFVIFLPYTSPTEGWHVSERLRETIEKSVIHTKSGDLNITISLGISSTQESLLDEQVKEADIALYVSKTTGRNKTTLFTKEMEGTPQK